MKSDGYRYVLISSQRRAEIELHKFPKFNDLIIISMFADKAETIYLI